MANRNRTEKKFPPHLEPLPPYSDDPFEAHDQLLIRNGYADQKSFTSMSGNQDLVEAEIAERKKRHDLHMEDLETHFREDKNPLFAWDAFLICRLHKRPVPEWVLEYLENSARSMMVRTNQLGYLPDIFGFVGKGGGATPWRQYRDYYVRRDAVHFTMHHLSEQPDLTITQACELAYKDIKGRWGNSLKNVFKKNKLKDYDPAPETIRKWYVEYQK